MMKICFRPIQESERQKYIFSEMKKKERTKTLEIMTLHVSARYSIRGKNYKREIK